MKNAFLHISDLLKTWLPIKMRFDNETGLSIQISHSDFKENFTYGYADIKRRKKLTGNTKIRIASISKTFTAVAILKLHEDKRLDINDPVYKHLSWFNREGHRKITITDLLTHSAGIIRDGSTDQWDSGIFPKNLQSDYSDESMTLKRGSSFKYSNYGYALLGQVIEIASGMTYEQYIQKTILQPLSLKDTYVDYKPFLKKEMPIGYLRYLSGESRKKFRHTATNVYAPATGFISTNSNLSIFLHSLRIDIDPSKSILLKKTKRMMQKKHIYVDENKKDHAYGLGIDILKVGGRKVIGHSGGYMGFTSGAYMDVKSGMIITGFTNSIMSNINSIIKSIFEIFHALDGSDTFKKSKHAGYYSGVWGDVIVSSWQNALLVFHPKSNNPLNNPSYLRKVRNNKYLSHQKSGYGYVGEDIVFKKLKGKDAMINGVLQYIRKS